MVYNMKSDALMHHLNTRHIFFISPFQKPRFSYSNAMVDMKSQHIKGSPLA